MASVFVAQSVSFCVTPYYYIRLSSGGVGLINASRLVDIAQENRKISEPCDKQTHLYVRQVPPLATVRIVNTLHVIINLSSK